MIISTITKLQDFLTYDFAQFALLSSILAGAICGVLGPLMAWKRLGLLGSSIAHASLAAIGVAKLINVSIYTLLYPFSILLSVLLAKLKVQAKQEMDSLLALFYSGFMALGILLISIKGQGSTEVIHFLFGNILLSNELDILVLFLLSVLTIIYIIKNKKQIILSLLNEELAITEGVAIKKHNYIIMILISITTIASLKLMGIVLMTSLLMAPTMIASKFTKNIKNHLMLSTLLGVLISVFGLMISLLSDLPSGSCIAVLALFSFFIVHLLKK